MSNRDRLTVDVSPEAIETSGRRVQILLSGFTRLGLVKVGNDTECVLVVHDASGEYSQVDMRGYRRLNDRKVRAALGKPQTAGHPLKGYEKRELFSIRLEPGLANYLRRIGGDNLSQGVALIAREHRDREDKRLEKRVTFPGMDAIPTPAKDLMFVAYVDGVARRVTVSSESLMNHFGATSRGSTELLRAYAGAQEDIQRAARRELVSAVGDITLATTDF